MLLPSQPNGQTCLFCFTAWWQRRKVSSTAAPADVSGSVCFLRDTSVIHPGQLCEPRTSHAAHGLDLKSQTWCFLFTIRLKKKKKTFAYLHIQWVSLQQRGYRSGCTDGQWRLPCRGTGRWPGRRFETRSRWGNSHRDSRCPRPQDDSSCPGGKRNGQTELIMTPEDKKIFVK